LGLGAVKIAAFTPTYRGLTRQQIAPATSANRILQQLGGVLGTVTLALPSPGCSRSPHSQQSPQHSSAARTIPEPRYDAA
jgi:hypothetical protein